MVTFMEKQQEIAENTNETLEKKLKSNELWEKLTNNLNALGPPVKNYEEWKKVI